MSQPHYDVAIVGLGAMGSAAAFHLALRGQRVLGLDRFAPPHTFGSSHGQTRIIREAYFEDPRYVPLVQRAYELWRELESRSGQTLLQTTGGLMIGPSQGCVVAGARRSAELHRLPHEILLAADLHRRFPALRPCDDWIGVWEPRAGVLFPEACIAAHLELARQAGAHLHALQPALRWEAKPNHVLVQTQQHRFTARQLLLTAGSWLGELWPDARAFLQVERQVLFWYPPRQPDLFHPSRCPIHLWEYAPGRYFYGFPDLGQGVKIARHHEGHIVHPNHVQREVSSEEQQAMTHTVTTYLPGLQPHCRDATVCLYTNTPDSHFLIDQHPAHPQVWVASPCSGHGFKFASAIGELLSLLLCQQAHRYDLSLFRGERFGTPFQTPAASVG